MIVHQGEARINYRITEIVRKYYVTRSNMTFLTGGSLKACGRGAMYINRERTESRGFFHLVFTCILSCMALLKYLLKYGQL